MKECNHKWVAMEDGSLDKFCVRCSQKIKRVAISMPLTPELAVPIAQPIARETMTIQSYGKLHEVDKENWMKEFNKACGIGIQMKGTL